MKLPNWFKIIWWIFLITLTAIILYKRLEAITNGQSVTADIFIFLIFAALMLVPIFSEVEFFGVKLKNAIDDLKAQIDIKFGDLKNEIRNSQTQSVNTTIQGYGPPPPDNLLPELEKSINRIFDERIKFHASIVSEISPTYEIPESNLTLFKIRYSIDSRIRQIWHQRFPALTMSELYANTQPTRKLIQELLEYDVIDKEVYHILREILSICNYGVHGEKVTENQLLFVTNNSKKVLDYLNGIG